jgi:HK97 family phage major capsid protein
MLSLASELSAKFERLAAIRAKAKEENRDLSRREAAEVQRIKKETEQLRERLPEPDPRAMQWNGRSGRERDKREPDLLKPEESFAAGMRERRGGFAGAGLGEAGLDDGSLGRVLGALVTGDRSHLNDVELRAMAEGAGSGQYLIAPELSSMVIDAARAQSVAFKAGALTLEMEEPIVYIPRLDTPVVAEWHAENEPLSGSDQTWSRVTLKAKTVVAGPLKLSRELYEDTQGTEAGAVIAGDLAKQLGLALDLAVFEGSGIDPEPPGSGPRRT